MSRRRIVVAIVVVLGWAALAGAEEASTPPAATRALSNTPFQLVLYIVAFAVSVTFLPLLNAAGLAGAYALYSLAAALSVPFVWAAVRETRGKALEQM
jgi:SP family arabinose:H+ symporter-like MFS transporter